MPLFSTRPTTSLSTSIRNALGAGAGADNPLTQIAVEQAAAKTAHEVSLATKVRLEAEALREAAAARKDPALATRFASNAAGLDQPTGERLAASLRGDVEQPGITDVDDADVTGTQASSYPVAAPAVTPGQRRQFQSALGATIANLIATGKTNADQLTKASGNLQGDQLTEAALEPGISRDRSNQIIAAASGKTYTPFRTNAQGTVINTGSGELNEGGQLAGITRAAERALASSRGSQASLNNARREYVAGAQTDLAKARAQGVRDGKPATPVAPERITRMVDMTAQGEYKIAKAAYDALPFAQRQKTQAPSLSGIRAEVASRYSKPDTQQEIADAHQAIANGKDPAAVRARFRQRRGFDLPEVPAGPADAADDGDDDEE